MSLMTYPLHHGASVGFFKFAPNRWLSVLFPIFTPISLTNTMPDFAANFLLSVCFFSFSMVEIYNSGLNVLHSNYCKKSTLSCMLMNISVIN